MDHTYEEIRNVVIDILAEREKAMHGSQYRGLLAATAQVFHRRDGSKPLAPSILHYEPHLSSNDAELVREVFWDLFRQGIITLGMNDANRELSLVQSLQLRQEECWTTRTPTSSTTLKPTRS